MQLVDQGSVLACHSYNPFGPTLYHVATWWLVRWVAFSIVGVVTGGRGQRRSWCRHGYQTPCPVKRHKQRHKIKIIKHRLALIRLREKYITFGLAVSSTVFKPKHNIHFNELTVHPKLSILTVWNV